MTRRWTTRPQRALLTAGAGVLAFALVACGSNLNPEDVDRANQDGGGSDAAGEGGAAGDGGGTGADGGAGAGGSGSGSSGGSAGDGGSAAPAAATPAGPRRATRRSTRA